MVQSKKGYTGINPGGCEKEMANIEVNGYYRKNGTFVKGYFRHGFKRSEDLTQPDKFMVDHYKEE